MKKKSLWLKIFSFVMIVCFAITCTGCIFLPSTDVGDDGGDGGTDFPEVGGFTEDMLGSKILYRPDNYDYDEGSGAEEGATNDYYGQYAYRIMEALYSIYGITTNASSTILKYLPDFASDWIDTSNPIENFIPYLYDSIRYQVDTVGTVTQVQVATEDGFGNIIVDPEDKPEPIEDVLGDTFTVIGADTSVSWNWKLNANTTGNENLIAYAYFKDDSLTFSNEKNNHVYTNAMASFGNNMDIISYYQGDLPGKFDSDLFKKLYLTENTSNNPEEEAADFENYSEYVQTLEYVIYCYAIDLEPAEVTVTTNADGSYDIQIGDFQSVEDALNSAKNIFKILGSYVGLVDRQITKIENWIIDNIIGETAVNDDDILTSYPNVTVYMTEDYSKILGYDFSQATNVSTNPLGRDYETAVRNIVDGVCTLVSIGNDDGEDVTIDDRFLASEIIEYAGDTYAVSDDTQFPVYVEGAQTIRPLEYQSVAIMMKNEVYVSGLWIALKYDAGLDGTTAEDLAAAAEDPEHAEYIDVIVDLNYYNHETNTRTVIDSKQVRVYDGSYDMNYLRGFEGQEGSLADPDNGYIAPDDHSSGVVFDGLPDLHVNPFNPNIGEGILMTDVGSEGNYEGNPIVSTEPLVLVGTTDVRKYYEVVEYGTNPEFDQDELPEGYTYISGRFNPNMFSGEDGCDYLEVTFKVLKEVGNIDKNYKFYTGIANIMLDEKPVMS